jgi:23S rRNA (adenine1618-N6)-methyltransferase
MCNPPFYASQDELLSLAKAKSRPPFSACTGSASEMITPGGEIAFANRLLFESLQLKQRVRWYTIMFGKLSSISAFVPALRERGVTNWAVTEFQQGGKTKRWGVAWSFRGRRPPSVRMPLDERQRS